MNFKDKIIKKLLEVGKKHRILVYPTLALVAVVSAISHAIYWGKGNGKKLVASAMVMVMLITQSLFLTSSADTIDDSSEPGFGIETGGDYDGSEDFEDLSLYGDLGDEASSEEEGGQEQTSGTGIGNNVIDVQYDEEGNVVSQEFDVYEEPAVYDAGTSGALTIGVYRVLSNGTLDPHGAYYIVGAADPIPLGADECYDLTSFRSKCQASNILEAVYGNSAYGTVYTDNAGQWLFTDQSCGAPLVLADNKLPATDELKLNGLRLYFKTERTAYDVDIVDDIADGSNVSLRANIGVQSVADNKISITVPAGDTLTDATSGAAFGRLGYEYVGLKSGSNRVEVGGTFEIPITNPDDTTGKIEVTADLKPLSADVSFNAQPETYIKLAEGETATHTITGAYNENITLPDVPKTWAYNDGYSFVGWNIDGKTVAAGETVAVSSLCEADTSTPDPYDVKGKTINAVWIYKNIELYATSAQNCKVSYNSDGSMTVTAQYGDTTGVNIYAKYKGDTAISADSTDYSFVFSYYAADSTAMNNFLETGGIGDSGSYKGIILYPRPNFPVSKVGTYDFPVNILDKNMPDVSATQPLVIHFVFEKKKIKIDETTIYGERLDTSTPRKAPTMAYSGSKQIRVETTADLLGIVSKEGVKDDVGVVFNSVAIFDTPDAGTNKPLTLTNVQLTGVDADKYVLVDSKGVVHEDGNYTYNVGTITRLALEDVKVIFPEGQASDILFGENINISDFEIKLDNPAAVLTGADLEAYNNGKKTLAELLGFTRWDTDWVRYGGTGEFYIRPEFSSSNYSVSDSGKVKATVKVTREAPEKDVNYKFDREKAQDGFYNGLIITACGGYDKIRLIQDYDGTTYPDVVGMNSSDVQGLFSDSIAYTKETGNFEFKDKVIRFQMYNSKTGAVTETKTVTLSVDTVGPEYVTHTVTPNIPYLNEFNFGSYYHSQEIDGAEVANVAINVKFTSKGSGCSVLHYCYVDENGNTIGDINRTVDLISDGSGNWYGSIIVGTGEGGQLIIYATDTTGNDSDIIKLKLDPANNEGYDSTRPTAGSFYEWMVENTKAIGSIAARSNGQTVIASPELWYNSLEFSVAAKDTDSGINKIVWSLTTPDGTVETYEDASNTNIVNATKYGKITESNFSKVVNEATRPAGAYTMTGVIYDNAGNATELNIAGPFNLDCKAPVLTDKTVDDPASLSTAKLLVFKVVEGPGESQISRAVLQKKVGDTYEELKTFYPDETEGYEFECSYNIEENGTYRILAYDKAGNSSEKAITFTGISDEKPLIPTIESNGVYGKNGWYVETAPSVTIKSTTITETDRVPVQTYYTINSEAKKEKDVFVALQKDFNVTDEGVIEITAVAKSSTGKESDEAEATVKVDLSEPIIEMQEATTDASGRVIVNFVASDSVSGINTSSIKLNGENIVVKNTDGIITGSFVIGDAATYEITVEDMAGNEATLEFVPMDMDVSPITEISSTGAKLDAKIYKGTYDIANCYIAFRKAGASSYEAVPFNKRTQDYGISMDYEFTGLQPDTVYEYRVYAVTQTSKETKVVDGSFKTGDGKAATAVYGSVRYAAGVPDEDKDTPIYVSLFEGNTYIAGKTLNDVGEYNFTNVSDGTYRVVATNGKFTQTKSVTIENGAVTYPADYIANRGVNFTLSNLSTRMVLSDGAVKITADGLDQVFDRSYTAVITEEDWRAVDNGASIDVTLYADYLDVTEVSSTTQGVFEGKIKNGEIVRYIELSVVKTVRDENGNCINGTPVNVTRLVKPVTIAFPLGDLAGQNIGVASLHGSGNAAEFINWYGGGEAVLTKNYVTITTSKFSIYALYRVNTTPKSYKVTWKDGDGNTMKVETVVEGGSATPPVTTPRKTATSKYTYTFSSWDTDYSNIKSDTIISAWFTANEIKQPDDNPDNPNPSNPGGNDKPNNPGGSDNPNPNNPGGSDTPNPEPKPADISTSTSHYSYLGSAQSPNTGDETLIVVLTLAMMLSLAGIVVVMKKQKKH